MARRESEKKHKSETVNEQAGQEPRAEQKTVSGQASEIDALKKELEEQKKMYLYLRADFENFKRNVNKERLELTGQGEDSVLKEMFAVLQSLERAIKYAKDNASNPAVVDGLELVRREIFRLFEKFKVSRIPTEGQKFDPRFHEAIAVVDAQDVSPGTVLKEERPGFVREGKVLQLARVVVVKEPSETTN